MNDDDLTIDDLWRPPQYGTPEYRLSRISEDFQEVHGITLESALDAVDDIRSGRVVKAEAIGAAVAGALRARDVYVGQAAETNSETHDDDEHDATTRAMARAREKARKRGGRHRG